MTAKMKEIIIDAESMSEDIFEEFFSESSDLTLRAVCTSEKGKPAAGNGKVFRGASAVSFYLELMEEPESEEKESFIVVAGRATRLAEALMILGRKPKRKLRILICGGGIMHTDATASAEENFYEDPHAVKTVLDSGLWPLIIPLDLIYEGGFGSGRKPGLDKSELLRHALRLIAEGRTEESSRKCRCSIALRGENRGELLMDSRERAEEPNCRLLNQDGSHMRYCSVRREKGCGSCDGGTMKVIMDADTGSDDAISLMCAALCRKFDIRAICSVWGNSDPEHTADNGARVMSLMGKKVPIYKGLDTALFKYQELCRRDRGNLKPIEINGEVLHMHVDELPIPEATYRREEESAVSFYLDYFSDPKNRDTAILATGPLSNLGLALSIKPEIGKNIREIIIMGGGLFKANITPCSEANFNHDPEAANIVLNCGAKVTVIPLDVTHKTVITEEEREAIRKLNNPCALFAAKLLRDRSLIHDATQPLYIPHAATAHDAMTAAFGADRTLLTELIPVYLGVVEGGDCDGHCSLDRRDESREPNCEIALSGDREGFVRFIKESLAAYGDLPHMART